MTSKFDLSKDVPEIHNRDELKQWLRSLYIIDDIFVSKDSYDDFLKRLQNLIRGSFVIRECREYPIKFKFYKTDKKTYTLQLRHFYINMILWYPFIGLYGTGALNENYIMDCEKNIQNVNDYINNLIIPTLREYNVKSTTINYDISNILYNLRYISMDFSLIMGLNFSLPTFLDLYENNKELHNIMETKFDPKLQPHEVEAKLHSLQDKEIELYKEDPKNPIGVMLRAGSGIKNKQLAEFTIAFGFIPNLQGETIPEPVENSLLIKGFDKPSYLYIAAIGARKSLILNKKVMGKAGFFGKIVLLLARTLSMSTTVSDCGSKHLVQYEIKSKAHLKKLNGKYYKLDPKDDDLKVLDYNKDKNLIGKKIYARSPATCKLGNCVCPRCVGRTAVANLDISDGLSAFESEEITKVVNQSILSTKHLLTTNSEEIKFNKEFYDFFTLVGGEINPIINDNKNRIIEDYAIYIDPADVVKMEEQDYDSLYNTCIANGRFYIRNIANPNEKDILIQAEGEKEIFVSEEALDAQKKGKGLIYFKDLDDDCKLFEMVIMNKELTKALYDLMDLLNKENTEDIDETIDSMSQKFMDILVESKIDANVVAAELIINRLIRSVRDIHVRPDFSDPNYIEPYKIVTVAKAIEHNESPLIGISCQYIKRQFLSDELYEDKHGSSFIDPLYWTDIPTDNLKQYDKITDNSKRDYED